MLRLLCKNTPHYIVKNGRYQLNPDRCSLFPPSYPIVPESLKKWKKRKKKSSSKKITPYIGTVLCIEDAVVVRLDE